jgi:hypothetical protein
MSVDAIKRFLEDTKNHPDTVMVTIGETQIPLGSLRQLNSTERTQLADRLKAVETQEGELKTRQQKIVELATKAQAAYDAAEEARKAAAGNNNRGTPSNEDPFEDPWLKPVKTALEARDAQIKKLTDQLTQTLTTVGQAATIFAEDRWDREYNSIDFGKRDKKPTRQELIDFAIKENLTDRHKMPSVVAAWNKMSEADRLEEIKKQAREEGIEQGRQQALASRVPPPGVSGPGQAPVPLKVDPNKGDLGDLYGEAIKDPELRALLEQAASVGIM